jgi:hypothetical protein
MLSKEKTMETKKYSQKRDGNKDHRTPLQSDNNTGTIGQEGGISSRREQKPFEEQDNIDDLVTGNKEYDRHHKPERAHKQIKNASGEEKKNEINPNLPGNRPNNNMTTHAEDYGGTSSE